MLLFVAEGDGDSGAADQCVVWLKIDIGDSDKDGVRLRARLTTRDCGVLGGMRCRVDLGVTAGDADLLARRLAGEVVSRAAISAEDTEPTDISSCSCLFRLGVFDSPNLRRRLLMSLKNSSSLSDIFKEIMINEEVENFLLSHFKKSSIDKSFL